MYAFLSDVHFAAVAISQVYDNLVSSKYRYYEDGCCVFDLKLIQMCINSVIVCPYPCNVEHATAHQCDRDKDEKIIPA